MNMLKSSRCKHLFVECKLRRNLYDALRHFHSTETYRKRLPSVADTKDPVKILKHSLVDGRVDKILPCPRECDILIIGGSVMGCSASYFIKDHQNKANVVVVEQDPSYSKAAALLSAGGMRQQFSCRENIEMSQFGFEFFRRIDRLLAVGDEKPPDIQFNHAGYLILAGEDQADQMIQNHELQREYGAINYLLSQDMLKKKFPWINSEGIALASLGKQGEGWFDPAALLSALKGKSRALGTTFVNGKVVGFEAKKIFSKGNNRKVIEHALIELPNGDIQPVKAPIFINAAGSNAGEIARMVGIGDPEISIECSVPLPVEPRKRFVFNYHCPEGPGLDCPLVTDTSQDGVYFRREGLGNQYISGISPSEDQEHDPSNLDDIDYEFFDNVIWPKLAHRFSAFEKIKLKSAWAGYYDYNFVDHNLIIGPHPYFSNFIFANGSTGHGLQHSPAVGRAICELIMYNEYRTVNLERFSFNRFLEPDNDVSMSENNIY